MFQRVLIANRGEIACRIIRTCRRLGIESIAVYSDADATAPHVRLADRAVHLGPTPAADSYRHPSRLLDAAARTEAEAIHPGCGFLAENAEFAEACAAAGVVFVGPDPATIRAMGAKDEAKRRMEEAGVPVVPGYAGEDLSDARLAAEAEHIGYPLMVKAAAGGGGKGMRIVRAAGDLADAVAAARFEAGRAFGSTRVILERYLERPRHIEAQILADRFGRTLFVFERECTLQRRHQKVVEEAPSPTLDPAARAELGACAIRAAEAVRYIGACTVEFLFDGGRMYFIEMNTRLQVEHPVTEMVTGLDLVAWQLAIAAGAPLDITQAGLRLAGHAVEARLCAEDPEAGFLPAGGTLHAVRWPPEAGHLRLETGVGEGDTVGLDDDPMIARLGAHGPDRRTALVRLDRALAATRIAGVKTNRDHLRRLLRHPRVQANALDTAWLEHAELGDAGELDRDAIRLATADRLEERAARARALAARAGDPGSPWAAVDGFRLGTNAAQRVRLRLAGELIEVSARAGEDGWRLEWGGRAEVLCLVAVDGPHYTVEVDGRHLEGLVVRDGERRWLALAEGDRVVTRVAAVASGADESAADGTLRAPMPGRVTEVAVAEGDPVVRGTLLLKLEAMKMEHRVLAEIDGTVARIAVAPGAQVAEGEELVVIQAPAAGAA
ncbi:MAG: acetyl/propionyl/methylcrotonyl-CoA carboxylase subunit alpha [Alphaproteobacteria bacterium]